MCALPSLASAWTGDGIIGRTAADSLDGIVARTRTIAAANVGIVLPVAIAIAVGIGTGISCLSTSTTTTASSEQWPHPAYPTHGKAPTGLTSEPRWARP
jgi:hypothetical protein